MLGTAHSNNGINIAVADVHRRRGADLSGRSSQPIPAGGTAARPTIFYIDKDFANARLMQANAAVEWEFMPRHHPDGHVSLRRRHQSAALDRSQPRRAGRPHLHRRRQRRDVPVSLLRHRPAVRELHSASSRFESTAESRYNGLTFELQSPVREQPAVPRRLHARQGRGHRPRRHRRRPGQRRRRSEVRVEPGGLRRRSDRSATTTSVTASW